MKEKRHHGSNGSVKWRMWRNISIKDISGISVANIRKYYDGEKRSGGNDISSNSSGKHNSFAA